MKLPSFALVIALSAAASAQVDNNRVVAVINGEEIKGAEFYRRMEYLPDVGKVVGTEFVESTPAFWTIERIITEKQILWLARDKKVYPTPTELQGEVSLRIGSDPSRLTAWTDSGQTRAELEHQILVQLCQFKIATMGITVTDQEVDKFYKDYPSMFTIPKRYKLRVITVSDEAKRAQVDVQLQNGAKFADVAKALSDDVSKLDGGYFGTLEMERLAKPMQDALANVKVGGHSPWLTAGTQFLKIYIEEIIPASLQKMDDDLRRSIRRRMMLDRGRNKNDVAKLMAEARSKMKIEIVPKELAKEYDRIMKKFGANISSKPDAP